MHYLKNRGTLAEVLLLIDSGDLPSDIDKAIVVWLQENKIPFTIVFTKCDKGARKKDFSKKAKKEGDPKLMEQMRAQHNPVAEWQSTLLKLRDSSKDRLYNAIEDLPIMLKTSVTLR